MLYQEKSGNPGLVSGTFFHGLAVSANVAAAADQVFAKVSHHADLLELLESFGKEGVEQKCLEKFQTWSETF
jgi:hypothetical protein